MPVRSLLGAASLAFLMVTAVPAAAQQPAPPPPAVVVETVTTAPAEAPNEFVGRVEAVRSLDVLARVQGYIAEVAFQEGAAVETGQLLFRLDRAQYEAELAAAEAQLRRAEAAAVEAERSLARSRELRENNTVAQARLEEEIAAFEGAQADLMERRANVDLARQNLSYTEITASIDGRIGRALFTIGALVGPQSGPLARIVQIDPLRVVFSLTETQLIEVRQAQARGDAVAAESLAFQVRLPNNQIYPLTGTLDFIGSEVDPNTGTVPVRVLFPNPDSILLPGQFVSLVVSPKDPQRLPVVPFSAVQRDREGPYVFVVAEDDTVSRRRIATGARLTGGWAVQEGLEAGEVIVVQGTQRLRDGARVQPAEQGVADASGGAQGEASAGQDGGQ